MSTTKRTCLALSMLCLAGAAYADKVITKDGEVFTGKILKESSKAVLIGNPPLDPTSTLIAAEDIQTIVHEPYRQAPPAQRKRGITTDLHLTGNAFSSQEMSLQPGAGLRFDAGFRIHPAIEISGGMQWLPNLSAKGDGLSLSVGPGPGGATREYHSFWQYTLEVTGKIYPFFQKSAWKTEPYLLAGYGWSHLIPKGSGDSFRGAGPLVGFGAIRPLSPHVFLDGRFSYQDLSYDSVTFQGLSGSLSPEIVQHIYSLSLGISYRF